MDGVRSVIYGVLPGCGLLGAGFIMHDKEGLNVEGLPTAETIWIAAAVGAWA